MKRMRQLGAALWLTVVGVVCGVMIAVLNHAFEAHCGEGCSAALVVSLLAWSGALALVFPLLGLLLWHRAGGRWISLAAVTGIFVVLAVLPALLVYGYELHQRYWQDGWRGGLPDADFSLMVIAVEPVKAREYGTGDSVPIKLWERCVLGIVSCDAVPPSVEARCLGSGKTVVIEAANWRGLRRIEAEDLEGMVDKPRSMELCIAPTSG